jgi:SAM-dependent methyltransferase
MWKDLPSESNGYPTDVPYVRTFFRSLAPAWLDHVAIVSGFSPPERGAGFTFCEPGCGQGVTTAILAATHPDGHFHGIDVMPSHIEHARRFATEGAIVNINFHTADFATAAGMNLPGFDYIVAHGVYSWVNAESKAALRAFIDRHLKPGGLVYLSYNAIPGRANDLPFQRLMRALGNSFPGDSTSRFTAAATIVDRLADLKPPARNKLVLASAQEAQEAFRRGLSCPQTHERKLGGPVRHAGSRRDGHARASTCRICNTGSEL